MSAQHTQGRAEWVPTHDGRRLYAMVLPVSDTDSARRDEVPTVVFEAGAAASRSSWAAVQPGVGRFARAIVYDRSGLGRSGPDPAGRTLVRMADDLGDLLDHFAPGPFILVGHSAGGPIVRLAAANRLDRIAGLVLVDPTDEAAQMLFTSRFRRMERTMIRAGTVLARLRLLHLLYPGILRAAPPDVRDDLRREAFTPQVIATSAAANRTFLDELSAWREQPPELDAIPVTVISGSRAGDGMNAALRAEANASHAHRAAQSPNGRHVIAEHSSHYVPLTDPGVIIEEIRRLAVGAH